MKEKPWPDHQHTEMTTTHIPKTWSLLKYSAWRTIFILFCLFSIIYCK